MIRPNVIPIERGMARRGQLRLEDALVRYLDATKRAPGTRRSYLGALRAFAKAGIATVEDATPLRVAEYLDSRLADVQPETLNTQLVALSRALSWLERLELCPPEQVIKIRRLAFHVKQPARLRARFLTREHAAVLVASARQHVPQVELAILVGLLSGLRAGELSRLRWEDIDLGNRPCIHVRVLLELGQAGRVKNGSERVVPICAELKALLTDRGDEFGRTFLFPPGPDCLGKPSAAPFVGRHTLSQQLGRAARLTTLEHVTWPILRHTRASWWAQAGVPLAKIAFWLGHSTAQCERRYAALQEGYDVECEKTAGTPDQALVKRAVEIAAIVETVPDTLARVLADGRERQTYEGIFSGGTAPFGYRLEARRLLVVEREAEVIRAAFARYAEVRGLEPVCRWLDERGMVPRHSSKWRTATLWNMFKNRVYVGDVTYRGTVAKGTHSPLISSETFGKVQEILRQNSREVRSAGQGAAGGAS